MESLFKMFTVQQIAGATGGRIIGQQDRSISSVATDSRTINADELFVALRGKNFDGHRFINDVIQKGVQVLLAEERYLKNIYLPAEVSCVAVKNSLKALGDLAAAFRQRFDLPVIAVTGSNGKTTTKEMLATVLSQTASGLKTEGNLNNLIGLPQMIFRLAPEHRWAVLEMGMSEPGEIDRLAEIASPTIGLLLNAFPAHLASMGTVDAIARAKGELLQRIRKNGLAVVNADDPRIISLSQNSSARRISFGIRRGEVRAENINTNGLNGVSFQLVTPKGSIPVKLAAYGNHFIYNALATAAALLDMVSLEEIRDGLAAFRPCAGRFQLEQVGTLRLIDDSYNANPASCSAAIATLAELKEGHKAFVVLGDMLELGDEEIELHRRLGAQAASVADYLYLMGNLTKNTAQTAAATGMTEANIMQAENHAEIAQHIVSKATAGDLILIKGSRGMKMEQVAQEIRQLASQEN